MGRDCPAIDWRNGFNLAAISQRIYDASGRGTYPYITSHLHCGGASGATDFYFGRTACNLDAHATYRHAHCVQRDSCPPDSRTPDGSFHARNAGRYVVTPGASG